MTTTAPPFSPWLRHFPADGAGAAAVRLVCFPHAGGSAAFYAGWAGRLPGVETYAVQYPGRGDRIDEPPAEDLIAVACAAAETLAALPGRVPLALFGHSLGAVVALETARALRHHPGVRVAHLFASGSRDAPLPPPAPDVDPDLDELFGELVDLGGTDAHLAADPVFREVTAAYLLADARMYRTYRTADGPALPCPVTTIAGTADRHADLRPWHTLTAAGLTEVHVAGDHFYLTDRPPLDHLAAALGAPAAQGPRGRP